MSTNLRHRNRALQKKDRASSSAVESPADELEDFRRDVNTTTHCKRMRLIQLVRSAQTPALENGDSMTDNPISPRTQSSATAGSSAQRNALDNIREGEPSSSASQREHSVPRPGDAYRTLSDVCPDVGGGLLPPARTKRPGSLLSERSGPISEEKLLARQRVFAQTVFLANSPSLDSQAQQLNDGSLSSPGLPGSAGPPVATATAVRADSSRRSRYCTNGQAALSRQATPSSPASQSKPASKLSQRITFSPASPFVDGAPPLPMPCRAGDSTVLSRSFSWPYDSALANLDFQHRGRLPDGVPSPQESANFFSHLCLPTEARPRQALNARYVLLHKRMMARQKHLIR
jgi:hypothetical protein